MDNGEVLPEDAKLESVGLDLSVAIVLTLCG